MGLFKKSKEEKELDKAFDEEIEKMIKEEEEMEKSLPKEELNIFELLKEKDDAEVEELKQYMSEEEKEDAKKEEKYVKRLTVFGIAFIILAVVGAFGGVIFINYIMQNDLVKEVIPKMQEYYETKYGESVKIERYNIKELCHDEKDEENKTISVCNDGILAVANDGTYIITLDREVFADNKMNNRAKEGYNEWIKTYFPESSIIGNEPILSYTDYYYRYNSFSPYINILPSNRTFTDLYETNKLTVRDMIFYSGDVNFDYLKTGLDRLSDDTEIVFVNTLRGLPTAIKVYKNKTYASYGLGNRSLMTNSIAFYELDANLNGTPDLAVTKILENDISSKKNNYSLLKPYKITFSKPRVGRDEDPKTNYYFVEINSDLLNLNNMVQFNAKTSSDYKEIETKSYVDFVKLSIGGATYIFGDEPIGFAGTNISEKNKCYLEFC